MSFNFYHTVETKYQFTFQLVFYKLDFLITNSNLLWKEIPSTIYDITDKTYSTSFSLHKLPH